MIGVILNNLINFNRIHCSSDPLTICILRYVQYKNYYIEKVFSVSPVKTLKRDSNNEISKKDIKERLKVIGDFNEKYWEFLLSKNDEYEESGCPTSIGESEKFNKVCLCRLRLGFEVEFIDKKLKISLNPAYEEDSNGVISLKKEYVCTKSTSGFIIELKPHLKIVNGNFEVKKGYKEITLPSGASSFSLKEGYIDTGADTEVIEGYATKNGEPYIDDQGNFVIKDYYIKDVDGGIELKEGYTKDGSIDKRYQQVNGVFQLKKGYKDEWLSKGMLIEGYKADDNGDTHLKSGYKY